MIEQHNTVKVENLQFMRGRTFDNAIILLDEAQNCNYKEIMLAKGETPKGLGQFSKAFSEYHDEDRVEIDSRTQRVWLNIDFKVPKQTTLSIVDTT